MNKHISTEYLNIDEAASYLRVKKSWIYQNHKLLNIPVYYFGRQLVFKTQDLNEWALSKAQNRAS